MKVVLTKWSYHICFVLFVILNPLPGITQTQLRTVVKIPDIPGFLTLKCDFHMHTVFSDGTVWPSVRAEEAWRQGLDAIAITDHIENSPHKKDILINHNRSSEIALEYGDVLNITVIKGAEITREMPPGHLNAIFLKDASKLETETWRQAVRAAYHQGAFIFWNHPGWWDDKQKDDITTWHAEHSEMMENDWLHGIEIVNNKEYYPEAHRWCLEKNLTMLGNSDIHKPIQMDYEIAGGEHRPITLVFAKNNTEDAIKEALFSQRTAVYWNNMLIGKEEYLKPIFNNSIKIENKPIILKEKSRIYGQITNQSEINYELELISDNNDAHIPEKVILYGGKTILFDIRKKDKELRGEKRLRLPYKVKNLMITPEKSLSVYLEILVDFQQ
jgi:hypothetical protein